MTMVQPEFVKGGGGKVRERSDRAEGVFPSYGREICFFNSCMKTAFSCTLNAIIRSILCSGIDQFPTIFFTHRSTGGGGGGGHGPLVPPLATPVDVTVKVTYIHTDENECKLP